MTDRTRLLLRADGGPDIGSGHLARCLALAQAWRSSGGEVVLVSAALPPAWAERYRNDGIELRRPSGPDWADGAAWVVLDGYHYGLTVEEEAKSGGGRLLVIDDHGTAERSLADLILDQNLGASPQPYEHRPEGSALLLGTRFALLRSEFRRWRGWRRTTPYVAEKVLLSLGGSPSPIVARRLQREVERSGPGRLHTSLLEGVTDVATAMAEADLAIAASGSTCWELCFMGLPAVLMATAPNQIPLARTLADRGVAWDAGRLDDELPVGWLDGVHQLARDPERRRRMVELGQALVDGRGADRVAARLRSDLLRLRPVKAGDAAELWDWVNDPGVRKTSFSQATIPWETHVSWLRDRLADPAAHLYLASGPDGEALGQVRFEPVDGGDLEISVSVGEAFRGRGWGPALVDAGVRRVFAESSATRVVARVRTDNLGSVATFRGAAFDDDGLGENGATAYFQYSRRRDDHDREGGR